MRVRQKSRVGFVEKRSLWKKLDLSDPNSESRQLRAFLDTTSTS